MTNFGEPTTLTGLLQAVTGRVRDGTRLPKDRVEWTASPLDAVLERGTKGTLVVIEVPDLESRSGYQQGGGRDDAVMDGRLTVHVCAHAGDERDHSAKVTLGDELTRTWHDVTGALTLWDGAGVLVEYMTLASLGVGKVPARRPHPYSVLTARYAFAVRLKLKP